MSGGGGGYPSNYDNSQYGYGYGSQPGNNDSNYSPYQNQYPQHNPYPQGGPQQQHQQQQQQQQQQQFQPGFKMDPLNIDPLQAAKAISQAGNYWQGGQQFFQQRMGWLQGASYYFNVDLPYVRNKLFMLLTPYLPKWTYVRLPEQISGGNKYRPPRADDNAPDLYIPFMALFTYCVMAAGHQLIEGKFKPDIMYPLAWYACMAILKNLPQNKIQWTQITFTEFCMLNNLGQQNYVDKQAQLSYFQPGHVRGNTVQFQQTNPFVFLSLYV
eukprot:TRINITY_DN3360_c0_g1_i6.p2 TRINITY_DN3360_c0_g1~~TRINITY_DN3360_c0_g1_i6.p2  ORF type:complete len:269 (-),score=37.29 TRINITY_DN3360_c0_g1_i6:1446-2252(-)